MTVVTERTSLLGGLPTLGIARAVPGLSTSQVADILTALRDRPRYAGHVKRAGTPHTDSPICCWDMHDLILAPHFWEWALACTPFAAAYLETTPKLYSLNVFASTPSLWPPHPGIEVFHRDYDDTRFLALFVYLTDVLTPEDGAHLFQCGTQDGANEGEIDTIVGRAGTAFFADTRGLHMGLRPTVNPRILAWARWGVSDPPASYVRDQLKPLPKARLGARYPTDPALQDIVKLVVA